jgi:quercetin 2,3-dioxygenase
MFEIRRSASRGHAKEAWLESYHSFSFNRYIDRNRIHFSCLRVLNEDIIEPNTGFGMHPHEDMEIITYLLDGELRHQDSLGHSSVITAGSVQRMSAGTGIVHSEVNPSESKSVHLLQIWIFPNQQGLKPSYEERQIPSEKKLNQWCLIASSQVLEDALFIHQDASIYASILEEKQSLNYQPKPDRSLYLHVARGTLLFENERLYAGDAIAMEQGNCLDLTAVQSAEIILFDLPRRVA